jgi:ribosomal protein S7
MSLKEELQKLDIETVQKIDSALTERIDSSNEVLESEATSSIVNFPALNHLVILVLEQAIKDELPIEEVTQRGVGASHAISVITTLAEYLDLPSID